MSLRERPLPSIIQNTGFGNGKICWTTSGLKLDPHPLTPPPPPENILDQRMIMHQKEPTEMVGDGRAKVQANHSLFVPAVPGF